MKLAYILPAVLIYCVSKTIAQDAPDQLYYGYETEKSLKRIYQSDHLVVYQRSAFNKTLESEFPVLSSIWGNLKEAYGPLSPQPKLCLILLDATQGQGHGCVKLFVYTDEFKLKRSRIDRCDHRSDYPDSFIEIQPVSLATAIPALGTLVNLYAREISNSLVFKVCNDQLSDIVSYSISTSLYGNTSTLALETMENIQKKAPEDKKCFQNIFLPIFNTFGNESLRQFFNYRKMYWSKPRPGGSTVMNWGEYVHYWSGSTGQDILHLVKNAFNWTDENDKELMEARENHPYFLYSVRDTHGSVKYILPKTWRDNTGNGNTLYYAPPQIKDTFSLYIDNFDLIKSKNHDFIQHFWFKFHELYQPFGPNKNLNLIVTSGKSSGGSCTSSNEVSMIDPIFHQDHVIVCPGPEEVTETVDVIAPFANEIAKMVLKLSGGVGNWPAQRVSGKSMAMLLLYRFMSGAKSDVTANKYGEYYDLVTRFNNEHPPEAQQLLRKGYDWFYDWHKPIYTDYGKGAVIDAFLSLLRTNWPKSGDGNDYARQMNVGEFVHFWSAAAKKDLRSLANTVFNWTSDHLGEFYGARQAFLKLNKRYTCSNCEETTNSTIGWVVGVSVCALLIIAVAVGTKFWIYKKRILLLSNQVRDLTSSEVNEFLNGSPTINPADAHAPIHKMAFDNAYEIPKDRLLIEKSKILGAGQFGIVHSGTLKADNISGSTDTKVAVKTVKPEVDISFFKALLSEIKIMAFIGVHENIASLLGTITTNIKNRNHEILGGEVFVALEFCAKGDLLQYLRKFENNFVNVWKPTISATSKGLYSNVPVPSVNIDTTGKGANVGYVNQIVQESVSTLDLLQWSLQIANGMAFLSSKQVIHGDLAARNVLLTENNVAKISDFGLSRQLVNYSNYLKTSTTPVPWRWLAPESLATQTFSVHSDVWSFGITLWEIFTLGKVPYAGRTWDHSFTNEITAGLRVPPPDFGNENLYTLMMNCMLIEPLKRTPFFEILTHISCLANTLRAAEPQSTSVGATYVVL